LIDLFDNVLLTATPGVPAASWPAPNPAELAPKPCPPPAPSAHPSRYPSQPGEPRAHVRHRKWQPAGSRAARLTPHPPSDTHTHTHTHTCMHTHTHTHTCVHTQTPHTPTHLVVFSRQLSHRQRYPQAHLLTLLTAQCLLRQGLRQARITHVQTCVCVGGGGEERGQEVHGSQRSHKRRRHVQPQSIAVLRASHRPGLNPGGRNQRPRRGSRRFAQGVCKRGAAAVRRCTTGCGDAGCGCKTRAATIQVAWPLAQPRASH
jgi:hypothetical protein